jgi:hypothetical protein
MTRCRSCIVCLGIAVSSSSCFLERYRADPEGAGGAGGSSGTAQVSASASVGGGKSTGVGGSQGPGSGGAGTATGTGGQGGTPTNPCATEPSGWYCGASEQFAYGDPSTLYLCYDAQLQQMRPCLYGCTVMPPGTDDECLEPCQGKMNAWFCGASSDFSSGDANTRYRCAAGAIADTEACPSTCQVQQGPQDDICI